MMRALPVGIVIAGLAVATVGCVPGGMVMPVPAPHNDRPTVHGILLQDGLPMAGQVIEATSYSGRPEDSCESAVARSETSFVGEFELAGDKDLITLWWGQGPDGLMLCLPNLNAVWATPMVRSELPPFIPGEVFLMCRLLPGNVLNCVSSLDDNSMIDCADDLDYEYGEGWLTASERTPYTGRCVSHHDNGNLLERADFVEGVRIGLWTGYDETGRRDHQSYWLNGRLRRESVWHENGRMFRQTHYRSTADERGLRVRHGLNTVWDSDGSIESEVCWVDGVESNISPESCWFE